MNLSPQQQTLVTAIAQARADEKRSIARLETEFRANKAGARAATNAAVHAAWQGGVPKSQIGRDGLGIVSPSGTDDRLREYAAQVGATTPDEGAVAEPIIPEKPSVIVKSDDPGYTVTLDGFTHPDVGTDLHGTYRFDDDGDSLDDDVESIFAYRLWATKEVQDGVENA